METADFLARRSGICWKVNTLGAEGGGLEAQACLGFTETLAQKKKRKRRKQRRRRGGGGEDSKQNPLTINIQCSQQHRPATALAYFKHGS